MRSIFFDNFIVCDELRLLLKDTLLKVKNESLSIDTFLYRYKKEYVKYHQGF